MIFLFIVIMFLVFFLRIEVIGEAKADVVVAEVAPRGSLLIGCLVSTEAIFVVEDILELQT